MKSDDLNFLYQKIKNLQNAANLQLLNMNPQEEHVRLIPDESIAPSMFKPSAIEPNAYYANALTISAVKKNIFLTGEGFEDLEDLRECQSCKREIDAQFWFFCPFCEGKLSESTKP